MAEQQLNGTGTQFTEQHLEQVRGLLHNLKTSAQEAHQAGDTFMLSVYAELVRVVSPIVVKATARLEREQNASINKAHKELRKSTRGQAQASGS
jgi:hypothetical protein